MGKQKWQTYEEVARHLLDKFSTEFGLIRVDGKKTLVGNTTDWEIDCIGIKDDSSSFVIIECRRYTSSKLTQEEVGAVAFRILDTGASGGIIVTPIGLQDGAQKIASSENIELVRLNAECNL